MKKPIRYTKLAPRFDLPADISAEVGRLIVRWAFLEHAVQSVIWNLAQVTQPIGRLAVREPRVEDRLRLIKDLAELRGVEVDDRAMTTLISQARDISRNRDTLAHGYWIYDEENRSWLVVLTRGKWSDNQDHPSSKSIIPEGLIVTASAVQAIITQLEAIIKLALLVAEQVERQLEPPPEVHPSQFPRKKPKTGRGPSRPPHRP